MPSSPSSTFPTNTDNNSPYWKLPAPLAYSTIEMLREPLINSADELIHLLEVWLRHLGWLWLAEYLHGDEHDRALDQMLFQTFLEGQRDLSVGSWAYTGSRVSYLFQTRQWKKQCSPIVTFDYGDPRDEASPLSRLLHYRNSFAHGSFDAQEHDILTHRALLWELLQPIQSLLEEYPIVFWDPVHSCVRVADGLWSTRSDLTLPNQKPYQPYLLCGPVHYLPLFPMLQIKLVNPKQAEHHIYSRLPEIPPWHLSYISVHDSNNAEKQQLFQYNTVVTHHLKEYQQQRAGYLDFQADWDTRLPPQMSEDAFQELTQQTQATLDVTRVHRPNFVLLSGYPGSGKSVFVARASELFHGFHQVIKYRIEAHNPTHSATTFLRYVLRAVHQETIETPETKSLEEFSLDELRAQFYQTMQELSLQEKRLLLGVDQFHLAYKPYREEKLSIYDVLAHLHGVSSEHLGILLTARPGYRDDLLHDTQISIPPVDVPLQERYDTLLGELGLNPTDFPDPNTPGWSEEERIFQRVILFVLGAAPRPLTAFEVRELLERILIQRPNLFPTNFLFSPRIAHTLWELRPVLLWQSSPKATHKTYEPFCKSFKTWLVKNVEPG